MARHHQSSGVKRRTRHCIVMAAVWLLGLQAFAASPGGKILSKDAYWRWRVSWRKPMATLEAAKAYGMDASDAGILPVERIPFTLRSKIQKLEIPPPPEDWIEPEFNDRFWPRDKLNLFGRGGFMQGMIAVRGKFMVENPDDVKSLRLVSAYTGGVVVYLNGEEVARRHMPDGPVTGDTAATLYPVEAWTDSLGKLLPKSRIINERIEKGETSLKGRSALRDRESGIVEIPPGHLREGVNVLAVAVHRADYHPLARTGWFNQRNIYSSWWPIGLKDITLSYEGLGILPNTGPPRGLRVWNLDIHQRIDSNYYPDPTEALLPIVLVGARNGTFSGCVCVSSQEPLPSVVASTLTLKHISGRGELPADSIEIRNVVLTDTVMDFRIPRFRRSYVFDGISREPSRTDRDGRGLERAGTIQPLWIRVHVPRDAAPGDYRGALKIAVGEAAMNVPVELHVSDWALPDPKQFRTYAGFYQSPTSLARKYGVDEWSEEHWKLMEKSFALLGRVGNDFLNVNVVDRTQFGNPEGMVYWIKRPDGGYDYDLSVLDRLLKLTRKQWGAPSYVACQVWHAGGWKSRAADQENTVQVLDPATGKREAIQVPVFGTPESKAFWTAALNAIRGKLAEYGMEESMCLGILSDSTAPEEVLKMFDDIMPDIGWMRGCHSATSAKKPYKTGPATVVLHEHCYGMTLRDPADFLPGIWNQDVPTASYFRSDFDSMPPLGYRSMPERSVYQGKRGFGRVGFDFWMFEHGTGKRTWGDIFNFYPMSSCAQRRPTLMKLAWHDKDGPVSTVSYELVVEGLQETEAMMFITRAMDTQADTLGAELVAECKALLVDRINMARVINTSKLPSAKDYAHWQTESRRVYETAAKIASKLSGSSGN